MPQQEYVLTVFVASPSDVQVEREALEKAIREYNLTWSRAFRIRFELIRWETHAFPGLGDDAQAVINDQVPHDYNLFIGIMWCRYGTATGRSGSGTVEEFERARTRYGRDPSNIKIMLYFKDAPPFPEQYDLNQLAKVNEFRDSLPNRGVLYWTFNSLNHFEKLIRIHLARQVQISTQFKDFLLRSHSGAASEETTREFANANTSHISIARSAELVGISRRISEALEQARLQLPKYSSQLDALTVAVLASPKNGKAVEDLAQIIFTNASSDMRQLSVRLNTELVNYRRVSDEAMNAFIRSIITSIGSSPTKNNLDNKVRALKEISKWKEVITRLCSLTTEFGNDVAGLPDVSEEFTAAKHALVYALDRLASERENELLLFHEGEIIIRNLFGEE